MTEQPIDQHPEADTRRKNSGNAGVEAGREQLSAGFAALAARLGAVEPEQSDLLDGSPDFDGDDVLSMAAKSSNEGRRARGRPSGSQNKRNADVFDYLAALGHRDPAVTLSLIQSADPKELARALACTYEAATALIMRAAAELMPYKYAKRPQAIEVTKRELHLFVAGDFDTALPVDHGGAFSLTNGAEIVQPVMIHDEAMPDKSDS